METANNYFSQFIDLLVDYGPKFIAALLTLIIGLWIIKVIVNQMNRLMLKKNIDESLRPFLKSMASVVLKILLVISVMSMVGIAMTSFIALLGAAGLLLAWLCQGHYKILPAV